MNNSSSSNNNNSIYYCDDKNNYDFNILITGVTGYIGSNLISPILNDEFNLLKGRDTKIFALVRRSSVQNKYIREFTQKFNRERFQVIEGDFIDQENENQTQCIENLRTIIKSKKINVIIHLAAMMDFYTNDKAKVYKTNVIGVENLLKASINKMDDNDQDTVKSGSDIYPLINRFIYSSTTETMGGRLVTNEHTKITEGDESGNRPDFYYGETKLQAEALVNKYQKKYQLDTIILRFTGVYGKNDEFSMFELMNAASIGLLFMVPKFAIGHVMYTYIDDVIQSILLAMIKLKKPSDSLVLPYTYIICPNHGMEYKEVIQMLNAKLGRWCFTTPLPLSMTSALLSGIGSIIYKFKPQTKPFLFKEHTLEQMLKDRVFSNLKAKDELNFHPKFNLRQGLKYTCEDYILKEKLSYYPISPVFIFTSIFFLIVRWVFKII